MLNAQQNYYYSPLTFKDSEYGYYQRNMDYDLKQEN
jgi:hypothetical protein